MLWGSVVVLGLVVVCVGSRMLPEPSVEINLIVFDGFVGSVSVQNDESIRDNQIFAVSKSGVVRMPVKLFSTWHSFKVRTTTGARIAIAPKTNSTLGFYSEPTQVRSGNFYIGFRADAAKAGYKDAY